MYMYFDEQKMEEHFTITDIRGRGILRNEIELIEVAGKAGAFFSSRKIPVRILEVDVIISADNPSDLRDRIKFINGILSVAEPRTIVFSDDDETIFHGIPAESEEEGEIVSINRSTIVFVCADPFSYSPELEHPFEYDVTTLNNEGSEEAEPIFEIDVLTPVTFALIQNDNDEYMMIGRPAEVDDEIVQTDILMLEEQGDTIGDWLPPVEDNLGQGEFTSDGTGITVLEYGEGSSWHGPARSQEIDPIQDFIVEMHCRVDTSDIRQTHRITFTLFDEDLEQIGMMRIWNNSKNANQVVAEGRYGEYVGKHINYAISSRNYKLDRTHFHGIIRMTRIGNRFTFYVTRMNRYGEHDDILSVPFIDSEDNYSGRLKYIQIDIAKHGDSPNPDLPRIQYLKVIHKQSITVDQTPYIANRGDKIIFNHKERKILLNGENIKTEKDFGATYFTLNKGENELVQHPSDSFATIVKYNKTSR